MAQSRNEFLKSLVGEYLDIGVGSLSLDDITDKMLEDGHITADELANEYGRAGFRRVVISPVTKQRKADGSDKYMPNKQGGWIQTEMAGLDDVVFVYWSRKHHYQGVGARLSYLRQYIIDTFDVDPDELPDPTGGHEDEED